MRSLEKLPWNFDAVPERRPIDQLNSFAPLSNILDQRQASALFKDYIENAVFNFTDDDADMSMLTREFRLKLLTVRDEIK